MPERSPPSDELHAIVGEAIKTLVEMGVAVEKVGEFALRYPPRVAVVLEARPPARDEPVDLETLIHTQVVKAVRVALDIQERTSTDTTKIRMNVIVGGKRTSITIQRSIVEAVAKAQGSQLREAKARIRKLAEAAPMDVSNRSAWTEGEVHRHLLLLQSGTAGHAH